MAGPASAFDFVLGDNIKGSLITLVTGGMSQRLRDQSPDLTAAPGTPSFVTGFQDANMGDLNYKKGDIFALYVKGSHELLLTFPEKFKFSVVYMTYEQEVFILAIAPFSRKPGYWRLRKNDG